jgi:hypothetical protein
MNDEQLIHGPYIGHREAPEQGLGAPQSAHVINRSTNRKGNMMSYSLNVKGATKAEAKSKVAEELAAVVAAQPVHAADQAQAEAAVNAFVDILPDVDAQDVAVSVSGSVWVTDAGLQQASVNVSVALAAREQA